MGSYWLRLAIYGEKVHIAYYYGKRTKLNMVLRFLTSNLWLQSTVYGKVGLAMYLLVNVNNHSVIVHKYIVV